MRIEYVRHGEYYDTYVPHGENYLANGVWNHNTGKSFSILSEANAVAEEYPGSRQLFAMQTRVSMNRTILPMWESKVLWRGHPAIHGTATYQHRSDYQYPNGSVIDLTGLANVQEILSAEYDRIRVFQAEQTTLEAHEFLLTRLRHGATPYHQITDDVNPVYASHWLNRRPNQRICVRCFEEGDHEGMPRQVIVKRGHACKECGGTLTRPRMRRIEYRHKDNPRWYDHAQKRWTDEGKFYVGVTLEALTGVRRERLLKHRWVSAEGLVWPEYDTAKHLLSAELRRDKKTGKLIRGVRGQLFLRVHNWKRVVQLLWTAVSVDWGFTAPGCMQLWGFDFEGRAYRIREIYRRGKRSDWWADQFVRWHKEYGPVRYAVCDPEEPERIDLFNDRLGYPGGREEGALAFKANNAVRTGLDLVGDMLKADKLFFVRDSNEAIDDELVAKELPWCAEMEIEAYVQQKTEGLSEEQVAKIEKRGLPDPTCADHACDTTRYLCAEAFGQDLSAPDEKPEYPHGSVGEFLDYGKAWSDNASSDGPDPWDTYHGGHDGE